MKKADVNNISTGQYPSSGLLGKTTNIQNIYYCKIVKGSYMVWRGKVWLLRKINRKKDKDYQWLLFPGIFRWGTCKMTTQLQFTSFCRQVLPNTCMLFTCMLFTDLGRWITFLFFSYWYLKVSERDKVWDRELTMFSNFSNLQRGHLTREDMMLTKIPLTGESVKFVGIMSIQEKFIAYIPE